MNKYFLFFIVIVNTQLFAQTKNKYLGGTVTFNKSFIKSEENSDEPRKDISKSGTMIPEIQWGYYINSSTIVGIGSRYTLSYRKVKNVNSFVRVERSQALELIPFIRKYKILNNHWNMFLHAEIGPKYNRNNAHSNGVDSYKNRYEYWHYNISIRPGLTYVLPNKKWALEGYANVASLSATFIPNASKSPRQFLISSSFQNPQSSIYFSIRLARYFSKNL